MTRVTATAASDAESERYERAKDNYDADEIKRRKESNGPYYSFEQLLAHLASLESPEGTPS